MTGWVWNGRLGLVWAVRFGTACWVWKVWFGLAGWVWYGILGLEWQVRFGTSC